MTDDVDIIDKLNRVGWSNSIGYSIDVSKEAVAEIERLREKCALYESALLKISRSNYGYQGIVEDYGHDELEFYKNAFDYFKKCANNATYTAKEALTNG